MKQIRGIIILLALLSLSCATTPPMTTEEHQEISIVELDMPLEEAVRTVTRYLAGDGYSIDEYNETTMTLTTGYKTVEASMWSESAEGYIELRIQVMFSGGQVEFFIYRKYIDGDKLIDQPKRDLELTEIFRFYLEG